MQEQEIRNNIALQISNLSGDKIEAIESYLNELTEAEKSQSELSDKYLTFWSDGQLFGIGIRQVVQIIQMTQITPLPDFPPYIKGVLSIRGEMVPIMDLRLRLGRDEAAYSSRTCIIIVHIQDRSCGLVVDAVNTVETISEQDICPPPQQANRDVSYLTGIANRENIILILAMEYLLSEKEIGAILDLSEDLSEESQAVVE